MSDKPENPPAFPLQFGNALKETLAKKQEGESDQDFTLRLARHRDGMSLRDYFAAKASEQDIQFWQDVYYQNNSAITREEAKYVYADEMLKAREQCQS